jgi:hypothetical protein
MEIQLFAGQKPEESLLNPVKNIKFCKPSGGIWTSSLGLSTSEWINWCEAEHFHTSPTDLWMLYPLYDAKIYEIDGIYDLHKVIEMFPAKNDLMYGEVRHIDFEAMSNVYDGIHLTSKGQQDTRWSTPYDLYGWDVESTLWFRWAFDKVKFYVNYKFHEVEYE